MKKMLAFILALAMVFALTACGNSDAKTSTSATEAPSAASTAAPTAAPTAAQSEAKVDFPTKQISIICPLGAGGASDMISRLYAAALEKEIGVPVVVENMPGAGTGIGLEAIAKSEPDGYTIGYMPAEVTTVKAMGNATVTPEDFVFLGSAMKIRALIAVPADSKWNTLEEFVADAKANPGSIVVGTAGVGNAYELGLRQFMDSAGIELNVVNFSDGTAAAIAAMLGGNVQACTAGTSEAKSYVESGQFKLLCHLSAERSTLFPDVPTATEVGYACNGGSWGAFAVPVGTPEEIISILREATKNAINSDAIKEALAERGFDEYYVPGEDFQSEAEATGITNTAVIEKFKLSAN